MPIALGIDIGGSCVKAALLVDGVAADRAKSARYASPGESDIAGAVAQAAGRIVAGRTIDAVGACLPGLYDRSSGAIIASVNVPRLAGVNVDNLIQNALRIGGISRAPAPAGAVPLARVAVLSDANATALDIHSTRNLAGRLLSIAIGTGVGAGVVDDHGFILVDGDSPGHLGQIDVSLDAAPPLGPDSGAGSLEAYIGAAALRTRFGNITAALKRLGRDDTPLRALARAIRIAHAIYRPQHICLAGGIGIRMSPWLTPLRALIDANLTSIARPRWTLFCADHDFHAALGAARRAVTPA